MNKLTNILEIGALALISLVGCARNYNIDGKIVRYNGFISEPMVIKEDNEKAVYHATIKWNSLPAAGKDISMIYIYENNKPSLFPRLLLPYIIKDTAEFNKRIKMFENYQGIINSIKNSKKKK